MLLLPVLSFAVQVPLSLVSEPQQRDDDYRGLANPELFRDTVHSSAKGYEALAKALRPYLEKK
jgi:lysophospholipase L1-like esterase